MFDELKKYAQRATIAATALIAACTNSGGGLTSFLPVSVKPTVSDSFVTVSHLPSGTDIFRGEVISRNPEDRDRLRYYKGNDTTNYGEGGLLNGVKVNFAIAEWMKQARSSGEIRELERYPMHVYFDRMAFDQRKPVAILDVNHPNPGREGCVSLETGDDVSLLRYAVGGVYNGVNILVADSKKEAEIAKLIRGRGCMGFNLAHGS